MPHRITSSCVAFATAIAVKSRLVSAITCTPIGSPSASLPIGTLVAGSIGKVARPGQASRSEEHTSELQSLMRISYAVFCLKKKKNNRIHIAHSDVIDRHQHN